MSVLVADIGGTNVRFALYDGGKPHSVKVMKAADYVGPAQAAAAYLSGQGGKANIGIFAVAGPVTGADTFQLTNHHPWKFSINETREALRFDRLELLNDFHALALGVLAADDSVITPIGGGKKFPNGNIGIIGPGTGLGMASLVYDHTTEKYVVVAGEGPHVTAPATTQREFDLFQWLMQHRYSHVSAERVCSGKGLVNLYEAIRAVDKLDLPNLEPADVTARAVAGTCRASQESLNIMLGVLGRVAGNLALTNMTRGGVYFAGGILPKLGAGFLHSSRLRGEFIAKGRFTSFVDEIPTYLVDDPYLALRGLGAYSMNCGLGAYAADVK